MTVRKIVHVDMDAFYASVEQRDDPALRGRPVVVGGRPDSRSVVCAASYEARRFGVRSAMPCSRAARLCPDAVFVRPDFARYREVSRRMHAIFRDYTDLVEPLALDECYLDVTTNKAGLPHAVDVAREIRRRIREELGLTASAGVSSQKFVAKIASDHRKPDGLTVVPPERVLAFVHPLPVEKLWGVGPATAARLRDMGLRTIGDVARVPADALIERFGSRGRFLHRLSHGDDPRGVNPRRERKSRGAERTLGADETELAALLGVLDGLVDKVCAAGEAGRTVTVKVRYGDFTTVTRAETLPDPTADPDVVREVVGRLIARTEAGDRPVRLVGVALSGFEAPEAPRQLSLW